MIKFKWYKLKRAPLSQSFPRVTWIFLYLSHECDSLAASNWASSYVSFFVLSYGACCHRLPALSHSFHIRLTSYITENNHISCDPCPLADAAPTKMLRDVFMICIWYKIDVYNWHIVSTRRAHTHIHKNPPEISVATCSLHTLECLSAGFGIMPQLLPLSERTRVRLPRTDVWDEGSGCVPNLHSNWSKKPKWGRDKRKKQIHHHQQTTKKFRHVEIVFCRPRAEFIFSISMRSMRTQTRSTVMNANLAREGLRLASILMRWHTYT